jgi:hypothetical protein
MDLSLKGKKAIVTGGSRGIGHKNNASARLPGSSLPSTAVIDKSDRKAIALRMASCAATPAASSERECQPPEAGPSIFDGLLVGWLSHAKPLAAHPRRQDGVAPPHPSYNAGAF